MAIFGKPDSKKLVESLAKEVTIIATGSKIKGDINLTASLHIDGEIEGSIHSENSVTIGSKGCVKGDIVTDNLIINGEFTGSAESRTIEVLTKGRVKGKLIYAELTIEKGGLFEGESILQSEVVAVRNNIAEIDDHKKIRV